MGKIIKKALFVFVLMQLFILPSYSFEAFSKAPKIQIKAMLKEYNKALANKDIEKIKTFYIKDYKSADGFDLDESIQMLQKTYDIYKNIKYKTKVVSINTQDEWALVQIVDKTSAIVYPTLDKKIKEEKKGILKGKSVYNVYLKKEDNAWKITSDEILIEETSLKYV